MPRHRRSEGVDLPWGWLLSCVLLIALLILVYDQSSNQSRFPFNVRRNTELIDKSQKPALVGDPGWEYTRSLQADLDDDGVNETVAILARVTAVPGRPQEFQWDDGQPWQVYIRDGQEVTRVYSRFVQLGELQVFVTDERPSRLAIAESQGAGYALYVIKYAGPGKVKVTQLANLSVQNRSW